ncbi:hypothetical protein K435DRAFT_673028, partial [Dendrothele bispora CBS 962.96]
ARYNTATSNLKAHVIACEGKVAPPEQAITSFMAGGHYNKGLFRLWIDLWIARRQRPYTIVEDPELVQAFKVLNPNVVTVSDDTVSTDIKEIHAVSITHVASVLQKHPGFLHISFDGWTAPNVLSFLGMDVNFCDDNGDLVNFTLDFTP